MESSEEDDDFPSIESITPQSKVDSVHQSHTEKVCFPFFFPPFLLPNFYYIKENVTYFWDLWLGSYAFHLDWITLFRFI